MRSSTTRLRFWRMELVATSPAAFAFPASDLRPCLLEPIGHQIGAARDTAFVTPAQPFDVVVAQFAAHHLVAQKRRIADDDIGLRPRGLAIVGIEQGVAVLDAVQGAEDGISGDFPSVTAAPLDVADPDGDAGEFGGKFVDFDADEYCAARFASRVLPRVPSSWASMWTCFSRSRRALRAR